MSELIDTTEMYLRTLFELQEEGVEPLRARIGERLNQSGPTVSQTISRMQRDGLVELVNGRVLDFTSEGRRLAEQVMRRHRLAECMLVEVLKVPLNEVHEEACKWEHVISDSIEERILDLLGRPTHSPFGNPIPGVSGESDLSGEGKYQTLFDIESAKVEIKRIAEPLQHDEVVFQGLVAAGIKIGLQTVVEKSNAGWKFAQANNYELPQSHGRHLFVEVIS
jgi:DtxR family Mn-dependent transcriptional regulator